MVACININTSSLLMVAFSILLHGYSNSIFCLAIQHLMYI